MIFDHTEPAQAAFATPIAMFCAAALLPQSGEPEYVEAATTYSRVRGMKHPGLVTFKGIRYGGSVSGANRFKAAPPRKPWTACATAVEFEVGYYGH